MLDRPLPMGEKKNLETTHGQQLTTFSNSIIRFGSEGGLRSQDFSERPGQTVGDMHGKQKQGLAYRPPNHNLNAQKTISAD